MLGNLHVPSKIFSSLWSMSVLTLSPRAVVLGKRKALGSPVRRTIPYLSPSPRPSFDSDSGSEEDNGDDDASSEYDSEATEELDESPARPSSSLSSRRVSESRLKKYECSYEGCEKKYIKPSRLAEHERSHTGDVGTPFNPPSPQRGGSETDQWFTASVHLPFLLEVVPSRIAPPGSRPLSSLGLGSPTGMHTYHM
jgi:hypothetical protein